MLSGESDDDTVEKGNETNTTMSHRRRLLLFLAYFLLTYPRWSWGLFLFLAGRSLPLETVQKGLQQPLQRIAAVVNQESRNYQDCTKQFFMDTVPAKRNRTILVETRRIQRIQQDNRQQFQRLEEIMSGSEQVVATAQRAVRSWVQAQTDDASIDILLPLVADRKQCSAQNRTDLTEWVWGSSSSRRHVLQLFDNYRQRVDGYSAHLANYSMARAAYDYDYFVGITTKLAWLDFSFDFPDLDLSVIPLVDIDLLDLLDNKVLDVLNDAMVRVILLERRIMEFFESLDNFDLHYRDLYERLIATAEFVRDFLPRGIPIPSSLDLDGVPVADLLLPEVFEIPYFFDDLPSLMSVRFRYAQAIRERLEKLRQKIAGEISDQLEFAVEKLKEFLRDKFALEDYNPPLFKDGMDLNQSINEEMKVLEEMGTETRTNLDQSLRVNLSPNGTASDLFSGLSFSNMTPPNLEDKATVADFLRPEIPLVFLPRVLMTLFMFFLSHRWLIELLIQCFRAWVLFRRFWNSVTPIVPKIIYDEEKEEHPYVATLLFMQTTVFKHFVTPWMALALVLLPFAVVGATLWLPHVQASCIESTRGTVLARHVMVPVLINQAMMSGNTEHVHRQFSCNRETEMACYKSFVESDESQQLYQNAFAELEFDHNHLVHSFSLLENCIDTDRLDVMFGQACCGLEGYDELCGENTMSYVCPVDNRTSRPFSRLSSYLASEAFVKDIGDFRIREDRFNCSDLNNICSDGACTGVNTTLLARSIIEDECRIEAYAMKACLSVVVALYHAVMLNLGCTLMFNGLKQLSWDKISPQSIQLVTFMSQDGQLVKGADIKDRSDRIASAMRRFEVVGKLQLALGGWIFLVWIISFRVFREALWKFR